MTIRAPQPRLALLGAVPVLLCALASVSPAFSAGSPQGILPLVPKPASLEELSGNFLIDAQTTISVDARWPSLRDVARFLASRLREATGYALPLDTTSRAPRPLDEIYLSSATADTGSEAYDLSVTNNGIRIAARGPAGAFYALQTLFQLLPTEFEYAAPVRGAAWAIPCVRIHDAPRFPWRGMHLDVGRHFFGTKAVEEYIDLLSRYKFNYFHWHLTEDQGWRIEIKKYPNLTSVGSWRKETLGDGQPHGGFYTQEEVLEVVAYARARFVTIVPEIEMPGHCTAALAAYPGLSCTGGPFAVETKWRVFEDVYCAGNDRTFEFLQDVLGEVMELFPGPFIHVGGDECPKTRWKSCPRCQARMKTEGLASENELQSYFIRRIERFVNAHGKRLIGWDEILEGGLPPNATVMSWRGIDGGIAAATSGHDVVMTPTSNCYFDYSQGRTGEPGAIGNYLPLDSVYFYEPVPPGLTQDQARHILGAQGNVWTEYIPDKKKLEYMAFPRACAMSEVVWSPAGKKDFGEFSARMAGQYDRLFARGINVRIPPPQGFEGTTVIFHDTALAVRSAVPGAVMRYTTDGTEPNSGSRVVAGPILLRESTTVKARTFLASGGVSPVPCGVFSIVDSTSNGVLYTIVPLRKHAADTLRGLTYQMSLEGLPLGTDSAAIRLDAYLGIATDGVYRVTIGQGDSATLVIDGFPQVNNRAADWWEVPSGLFALGRGAHKISVGVVTKGGRSGLDLQIEGPGLERQAIPASMLRSHLR